MCNFKLKWIYILDQNYTYNIKKYLPENFDEGAAFEDKTGKRWLEIHPNGEAVVFADYAWDGCTPKFALFDIVIGTSDGIPNPKTQRPKAYYASLMHDVFCQFLENQLPLSKSDVDRIFLEILERDEFAPRLLYYAAVRIFGGMTHPFTRWKRCYQGRQTRLQKASS